jgi:uncharacterized protein (TIGR02147 family)
MRYTPPMEMQPNVFSFEDPVDYLNFEFRQRQARNSRFSLRAWARQIGYENPSLLSDVLKKERKLKLELASKLAQNLNLKGKSQRYFEYCVLYQNAKSELEKKSYKKLIGEMRPKKEAYVTPLSLEIFTLASEWYHWALLQGISLSGIDGDETKLFSRLHHLIDKRTFNSAIERLLQLELLEQTLEGKLQKTFRSKILEPEIPSAAIKNCHQQFLDRAKEALMQQPREERDFRSTTLTFSQSNIEEARKILQDCHKKLVTLAESREKEDVYQLNTQFFRLSKKKEEILQ